MLSPVTLVENPAVNDAIVGDLAPSQQDGVNTAVMAAATLTRRVALPTENPRSSDFPAIFGLGINCAAGREERAAASCGRHMLGSG